MIPCVKSRLHLEGKISAVTDFIKIKTVLLSPDLKEIVDLSLNYIFNWNGKFT